MPEFSPLLARSRTYHLFTRLYLEGLSEALWPLVQEVPELAAALPDPLDADELAADHQHLFGFNVFPYAGVFLDPEGLLNGPVADDVRQFFLGAGCPLPLTGESIDHLGHELAWLAYVTRAEAEAWMDDAVAEAERLRHLQQRFLDLHLLGWLPAFACAVEAQAPPFYRALAARTLALVLEHRRALGAPRRAVPEPFRLPEPPALLDVPRSGLKEIAAYLATPPWSGLFLSRDAIAALARALDVPRGFGDRRLMLTNLLRAAAEYDRLPALLDLLRTHLDAWTAYFTPLREHDVPGLADALAPWFQRLETTARLLERLRRAAGNDPSGQP